STPTPAQPRPSTRSSTRSPTPAARLPPPRRHPVNGPTTVCGHHRRGPARFVPPGFSAAIGPPAVHRIRPGPGRAAGPEPSNIRVLQTRKDTDMTSADQPPTRIAHEYGLPTAPATADAEPVPAVAVTPAIGPLP